jgi:hypothetical protein
MTWSQKALRALIANRNDSSPGVRFWCTFAIGQWQRHRRHQPPRAAVRALEARLDDHARPEDNSFWPIALEALAALHGMRLRRPAAERFRETLTEVINDPLVQRDRWQWAAFYCDSCDPNTQDRFDAAAQIVRSAGFDPIHFGPEF